MNNPQANEQFLIHVKNNDAHSVIKSITNGANIHANNDEALLLSAQYGYTEIVTVLLEHGTNVHACDDYVLRQSATYGHTGVVAALIAHGANVHAGWDKALLHSAENGHTEVVTILLANEADVHAGDDYALKSSAEYGHVQIVDALLQNGANVGAENNFALKHSSINGHIEVAAALLRNGANARECHGRDFWWDTKSRTCDFQWSTKVDRLNTITKLLKHCDSICCEDAIDGREHARERIVNKHLLNLGVMNGCVEVIAKFLECGVDIYCNDNGILKKIQQNFSEELALAILPYCCEDDYDCFPDDFIAKNVTQTKNARHICA